MSVTYRTVLVGCGRMGATIDDEVRDHPHRDLWLPYSHAAAAVACERTELVAVADVVPEKAEAIRQRYNVPRAYTDYREMIERERPEIVCIATRPSTHAEITIFAAEHGVRGIYCEKPLCCSMAEADAMLPAVERHGVKFNYGTQRRYMPIYRTMRELIEQGAAGQVQAVLAYFGAGAAQWSLTHATDLLLFLAGDPEVEFVQGTVVCRDEDWDGNRLTVDPPITSGYIRFANGVHGYLTAATGTEVEVCGTQGSLRTLNNGIACQYRQVVAHRLREEAPFPPVPRVSGTLCGLRDLAEALDTGRETQGPLRLACRSQEMILGIVESHRRGGARVPLPLADRTLTVARPDY